LAEHGLTAALDLRPGVGRVGRLGGPGGPVPKAFRAGTHRTIAPEATAARLSRLLPVLGITRVADVTGLDSIGIPVVMVCRPNARSLSVSQGKGLDLASARVSGLMEATELYHAERITLPVKYATANELRFTHALADVSAMAQLAISAYHDDLRLLWIEGRNLTTDEAVWVPYETVHLNCTLPLPPGSGCFPVTSNGLASGNHLLEALCHGLSEVVERDASTLWEAGGPAARERTRMDVGTVDDPACLSVLDLYDRAGIAVAVWEITSDVGVPAFRCVILDRDPDPFYAVGASAGMGCHPTREVALLRALTEAAQSRLTSIAGARDDMPRAQYAVSRNVDVIARLRADLMEGRGGRSFRQAPSFESDTFDDDLLWLLERLAAAGLGQVVAVDLTHEGLNVPVAKVIVPGLEPLADVPGYQSGPRAVSAAKALAASGVSSPSAS
jgi:YcaO-like protein with predicted kinase domain